MHFIILQFENGKRLSKFRPSSTERHTQTAASGIHRTRNKTYLTSSCASTRPDNNQQWSSVHFLCPLMSIIHQVTDWSEVKDAQTGQLEAVSFHLRRELPAKSRPVHRNVGKSLRFRLKQLEWLYNVFEFFSWPMEADQSIKNRTKPDIPDEKTSRPHTFPHYCPQYHS